jgi:uncharacterized membrane protein
MVALIFLSVVAAVFLAVVALEGGDPALEKRPRGLLTWIASGNWPAKIGGALMVVGVGALLRYAAINFDAPASLKLAFGIAAVAVLGYGSFFTAGVPQRRAISLALGGAAFGVAYLTAYSAYALFGYLPTMQGLGLLVLTAFGAGIFAVTRSALSLAVLSMVGAFMAPAFAVEDPGPGVVYGYYVAISALTLAMVAVRGWRPLIHLSFLFTLAGGAFFAWTAGYFSSENSTIIFPLLAMLVAVHVAMPICERRWARGALVESLDTLYLLALPVVAALTVLAISPSRAMLATQFWWFAAIWLAAALWLYTQRREGMASHAVIGLLMLGFGLAARFRDLPWELLTLGLAVAVLALAARRSESPRLHGFLAGLVLVLGAVHMIGALAPAGDSALFFNARFAERLIGAGLLGVAALTLARLRHALDSLMLTTAIGWAAFAVGAEFVRLDLVSGWLIVHWLLALTGFAMYFLAPRYRAADRMVVALIFAIGLSGMLAQWRTLAEFSWMSAFLAGTSLLAIAMRPTSALEGPRSGRPLAAIGAPILVAMWLGRVAHLVPDAHWQFPMAVTAAFAVVVLLVGYRVKARSAGWFNEATDIFAVGFAFLLAAASAFDIEREISAVLLELICIAALAMIASWNGQRVRVGHWIIPATVIGVALVLQANLLRWLGPAGDLDALDVAKMNWPTLVSLLWASIGAALTIWARRVGSRAQWSAGAAFLVGAAIKLLLLDFGSLGQLANILAVIAAGGVFLLVGWLAPMPPAPEKPAAAVPEAASAAAPGAPDDEHHSSEAPRTGWGSRTEIVSSDREPNNKLVWTMAIVAFVFITFSQCRGQGERGIELDFTSVEAVDPPSHRPVGERGHSEILEMIR